jgi:hypothetical protein
VRLSSAVLPSLLPPSPVSLRHCSHPYPRLFFRNISV